MFGWCFWILNFTVGRPGDCRLLRRFFLGKTPDVGICISYWSDYSRNRLPSLSLRGQRNGCQRFVSHVGKWSMLLAFRVHAVTWAPCYVFVPFCCANYAPVQSPSVFTILREYISRHFPGGEGKLQQCIVGRGSGDCSFSSSFRLVVLIIGISKSRAAISSSFQGFCYVCQVSSQFSKPCWSGIWLSHLPLVHLLSPSKILSPSPFLFSLTLFISTKQSIYCSFSRIWEAANCVNYGRLNTGNSMLTKWQKVMPATCNSEKWIAHIKPLDIHKAD